MAQTDPLGDLESGSHPLPEQPPGAAAAAPPQRQLLASGHGGTLSPHGALPGSPRPSAPQGPQRVHAQLQPPRFAPAQRSALAPQELRPQGADAAEAIVLSSRLAAAAVGVPLGALVTPLPPNAPAPPMARRPPVHPHSHAWSCLFCGHSNDATGALLVDDPQACLELQSEAVDFLQQRLGGGPGGGAGTPALTVLAVDATANAAELSLLKESLVEVVRALPPETNLALLTFGAALSVWQLNPALRGEAAALPAADMFPGHSELSEEALKRLLGSLPRYAAPLSAGRAAAEAAIRSLGPQKQEVSGRRRPRALGAALEAALYLARGPAQAAPAAPGMGGRPTPRGRVLLIATGPSTRGPGTVDLDSIDGGGDGASSEDAASRYFQWLARTAAAAGVSVDVVAAGSAAANVAALAPVAERSGGLLTLQEGFGQLFGAGIVAALGRRAGTNGGLDLKTSPGLDVSQIIGPAVLLRGADGAGGSSARPHMRQLNGVERGQGLGVILEVQRDLPQEFLYFQVILGWLTEDGSIHERCVTRRVRATLSPSAYLQSVDAPAAALLLAKRIVLEAARTGAARDRAAAAQLRAAIGRHLYHVAVKLGEVREEGDGGWFIAARRSWGLPPQLLPVAQALYHLQRGPMLGEVAGHPDERAALATVFLNASSPLAGRMLSPALYVFDAATGTFAAVEPVDIAVIGAPPLVLDHGSAIFVWLGSTGSSGAGGWSREALSSAAQGFVEGLASGRLPLPEVRDIAEESPDFRYISARLAPGHHDSPREQAAYYPRALAMASAAAAASNTGGGAAAKLTIKLPLTEEASLLQWARQYRVQLTAESDVDAAIAALARLQLPRQS